MTNNVQQRAYDVLMLCEPDAKCAAVKSLRAEWLSGGLPSGRVEVQRVKLPGRPAKPELVLPMNVPRRKLTTEKGRTALIHAVAHIEFNAINLALDAVYRFQNLPEQYISDWLQVAEEEAYHFSLLRERLMQMDVVYGDFEAHNGLWDMAVKTDHDVMVRMALVPRVLEARGLDVTPGMMDKLRDVGDDTTVAILEIILRDEIGHVAIGSHWFKFFCAERELKPQHTFRQLLKEYMTGRLKGPYHTEARLQAGFDEEELAALAELERAFDE